MLDDFDAVFVALVGGGIARVPRSGSPSYLRSIPTMPHDRHADERARPDEAHHPERRRRAGPITLTLFTMMVLMAIVTTLTTLSISPMTLARFFLPELPFLAVLIGGLVVAAVERRARLLGRPPRRRATGRRPIRGS
jgi:hypothetical protein